MAKRKKPLQGRVAGATRGAGRGIARMLGEAGATVYGTGRSNSETPYFVGRAVVALAADPKVSRWSGGVYSSWGLSEEYGFTDLDGGRPNIWPAVDEKFAGPPKSKHAAVQWRLGGGPHRTP